MSDTPAVKLTPKQRHVLRALVRSSDPLTVPERRGVMRLTNRERSQIQACAERPGIWRGVPPHQCDEELASFMKRGLVKPYHAGGYCVTDLGRAALASERKP